MKMDTDTHILFSALELFLLVILIPFFNLLKVKWFIRPNLMQDSNSGHDLLYYHLNSTF